MEKELVLYGTAKRISMKLLSGEQIIVTICSKNGNQSKSYYYFGVV